MLSIWFGVVGVWLGSFGVACDWTLWWFGDVVCIIHFLLFDLGDSWEFLEFRNVKGFHRKNMERKGKAYEVLKMDGTLEI